MGEVLLTEQIQRINYIMNYQLDKTSIENLMSEQWNQGKDALGYWKMLFNQLKKDGVNIKWQVANDPVKSNYMYWGPWVIWKDVNKNGGWPISFSGSDKKVWLFKFSGGKYSGQPLDNINLESKSINSVFKFSEWVKVNSADGGRQLGSLTKSKPKSGNVSACKTVDGKPISDDRIPAVASQIFKELSYAFDGAGTYEDKAVAAYKKITCKKILDAVNAKVAARGMQGIKNVGDWAKDEMSDYDYEQYRKIWTNLQKLGYKAPPVDKVMKMTGTVVKTAAELSGLGSLAKIAEAMGNLSFDDIFEGIREFLTGTAGTIITTILDATGIGKLATSSIWVIMTLWDSYKLSTGGGDWFKLFGSFIGVVTTGAIAKGVGKLLKPLVGTGGSMGKMFSSLTKQPWFKKTLGPIVGGIGKALKGLSGVISSTIGWLEKKLGITFLKKIGGTVVTWLEEMATKLSGLLGVKSTLQKKVGGQIVSGMVKDPLTDKAKELTAQGAEYATGSKVVGDVVKLGIAGKDLSSAKKDLKDTTTVNTTKSTSDYYKDYYKNIAKKTGTVAKKTKDVGKQTYQTVSDVMSPEEKKKQQQNKTT